MNFLAPTQNAHFKHREKSLCASFFLGKDAKKGPTQTVSGGLLGPKSESVKCRFSAKLEKLEKIFAVQE